jgi:cholest-4-en-3-one 26-monooxygenase
MDTIDLVDPDTYREGLPHHEFARLRASEPVAWRDEIQGSGYWAVTRYRDVVGVLRNPPVYSSWRRGALLNDPPEEFLAKLREGMMHRDPPDHARLRALVSQAFNPHRVSELERRVARYARRLVDEARGGGGFDFATEIAEKMPLFVICETLGIPAADRQALYGLTARMLGSELADPAQALRDGIAAAEELRAYGAGLGRARRAEPVDDLVSELVTAEIDGQALTDGEFQAFFMLLFNAGTDTTRSLLCHGLDLLLDRPAVVDRLVAEPALLPGAVEELLRLVSPVIHLRRTANRDTELAGVRIAEGDKVVVFPPSANRDAAVFADPERLEPARTPNPQIAFGFGPHYCLGAPLARLEARYVLGELLPRLNRVERLGPIVTARSNFVRRVRSLPIAIR